MSEVQWAVQHYDDNGDRLHVSRPMAVVEALAAIRECNALGGPCRLLRREIPDWSLVDDPASGVVS